MRAYFFSVECISFSVYALEAIQCSRTRSAWLQIPVPGLISYGILGKLHNNLPQFPLKL